MWPRAAARLQAALPASSGPSLGTPRLRSAQPGTDAPLAVTFSFPSRPPARTRQRSIWRHVKTEWVSLHPHSLLPLITDPGRAKLVWGDGTLHCLDSIQFILSLLCSLGNLDPPLGPTGPLLDDLSF